MFVATPLRVLQIGLVGYVVLLACGSPGARIVPTLGNGVEPAHAHPHRQRSNPSAPFLDEDQAIEAGRALGIGSAVLVGPSTVEVRSVQSWTLVYTAGEAGIQQGGGIRIALRHLLDFSRPQVDDPEGYGYVNVAAPSGVALDVRAEPAAGGSLFNQYFPWQHVLEMKLRDESLRPGQQLIVAYGDPASASPGMRVQSFDEREFVFKVYVDPDGMGRYLPLERSPSIEVVAAAPVRLKLVMPSNATVGVSTWAIVRAEDAWGNPSFQFEGTIEVRASDPGAVIPARIQLSAQDGGVKKIEGIEFATVGDATIEVSSEIGTAASNPVRVAERAPELLLLWGDLHGHTLNSDGRGTVDEFYDFARNTAGLDFCAVTDHAFEVSDAQWEQPIFRARSYYDYRNLEMYHGAEPQLNHIEDIFARLDPMLNEGDIFAIPHWGGRPANPEFHHPELQRMIEIFSEHKRSDQWALQFLKNGYRLGIIGSSDDHYGNPGHGFLIPAAEGEMQEVGLAAVAVYARDRTRTAVFGALYDRQVYATSGSRMILWFAVDGHMMGSEYRSETPPTIEGEVVGTAAIERIEITRNAQVVHAIEGDSSSMIFEWTDTDFEAGDAAFYFVRVLQVDGEEAVSSPVWVSGPE